MPYHIGIKLKWVKYLSLIGIAACILAFLTGILVMITRLPYLKLLLLLLCLIGGKLSFFSNITSEFWAGTKFTVNSLHSSLLLLLGDYGRKGYDATTLKLPVGRNSKTMELLSCSAPVEVTSIERMKLVKDSLAEN